MTHFDIQLEFPVYFYLRFFLLFSTYHFYYIIIGNNLNVIIIHAIKGDICMPNTDWTKLSSLQLGRYTEYFAKMEFASYGMEVYTTEVDDHGIDFIVKDKKGRFSEIQVKSKRGKGYVFIPKSKFDINNKNLYLTLLAFEVGKLPDIFLIPAEAWRVPNEVLKSL